MTQTKTVEKKQETLSFGRDTIYYDNKAAALQTIEEVSSDPFYRFVSSKEKPFIIDAGSNIGIAALFLKSLNPRANLLCVEPDPTAFATLKRNIRINQLNNVTLLNAAISNTDGICEFFGQITVPSPDARGNSIIKQWGLQRKNNNTIEVKSVRLSSYINDEVDFLKLDIEGAEQYVLEELSQSGKLDLIKEITIEVHQTESINSINNLNVITGLLEMNRFKVQVEEKMIPDVWPIEVREWVTQNKPRLFSVNAIKP